MLASPGVLRRFPQYVLIYINMHFLRELLKWAELQFSERIITYIRYFYCALLLVGPSHKIAVK